MRKIFISLFLFSLFLILVCCATVVNLTEEFNWKTPPDRPFPIMAWDGPPNTLLTDSVFSDMVKAGFNLCENISFSDSASIRKVLKLGKKYGIGMIINDPRIHYYNRLRKKNSEIEDAVRQWKDEPALLGYSIKDEPNSEDFPDITLIKNTLTRVDPGKLFYVNLFPNYASEKQLGAETYQEHVDKFIKTFKPRVLSFDHYSIIKNRVREGYYQNLEIIRDAAHRINRPFWAFTLSTPHYDYPVPTEGHIRFQLYSNLAYGAKGLQYFTYGPAMDNNGLIDNRGNKTKTYDYARTINREIQNMGPVLLGLESKEVFHTAPVPKGTKKFEGYEKLISCTGDPAVLGFFTDNESHNYIMVVNRSPFETAEIKLKFSGNVYSVEEVDKFRKGGQLNSVELIKNELNLYLLAGDGRLFMISY